MADPREAAARLVDDDPEFEAHLRHVLAVDAEREQWEFDDLSLDSGAFGEIVSRGIVVEIDGDGYRVTDRDAIQAALDGGAVEDDTDSDDAGPPSLRSLAAGVERRNVAAITVALAALVAFRLPPLGSVFRDGLVVLGGNDAYRRRALVEQLVVGQGSPLDPRALASLPPAVADGEALLDVLLWFAADLLGGTTAVGPVLAWYPVVAAVLTGLLTYLIAVRLTDDIRVGLASVALLAVTPIHAVRTGLGFADHHAFDYLLLAVVVLLLVVLADRGPDSRDRRTWGLAASLGVAVTAQTLAWDASPLLLLPLALSVAATAASSVRDSVSPLRTNLPLLVGLVTAAVLTALIHLLLGWHTPFVAYTPALLCLGALAILGVAEAAHRTDRSARTVLAVEAVGAVLGTAALVVAPVFGASLRRGVSYLTGTTGIAETRSLFSGALGLFLAPLFWFGFALFVAIPSLVRTTMRLFRRHDPPWIIVSAYGWYFLALSLVQIRFGGELALLAAVFGGVGFVRLAVWVDLARPVAEDDTGPDAVARVPSPSRRRALAVGGLSLGVGSFGALLTPIEHGQLTYSDSQVVAVQRMRAYADRNDWTYPDDYVFSTWSNNRFYNYYVNGNAESYAFARQNYDEFLTSTEGNSWYERLRDRVGFVVTDRSRLPSSSSDDRLAARLHDEHGMSTDHYRAVWRAADGSVAVFTLVPGAELVGSGPAGATVTLSGRLDLGPNQVDVEREIPVNEFGFFRTRVPQAGTFDVGSQSLTFPERAVTTGSLVTHFDGDGIARWQFDAGQGDVAYDHAGDHHATLEGDATWANGVEGAALDCSGLGYAETTRTPPESFSVAFWLRLDGADTTDDWQQVLFCENGSLCYVDTNGSLEFDLPNESVSPWAFAIPPEDEWVHVVLTYDGNVRAAYVDGEQIRSRRTGAGNLDWGSWLRMGGVRTAGRERGLHGRLDNVALYDRVLDEEAVRELYETEQLSE